MASPRVMPDASVSESQNWQVLEFHFTAATAGTRHALIPAQAAAANKVWAMTGDGSTDMTSAIAQALVKRPDGKTPLSTDESNLALGLITYFTNTPAAADGAFCHAFAVGGAGVMNIMKAELEIRPQGTSAANATICLANTSAQVKLSDVALNGTNALLKDDGTTAVAAGTDTLVVCNGVVFGALASVDVLDTAASGAKITLKLYVK